MVKRRYVSKVDWTRALSMVMASRNDLRTQTALAKRSGIAQSTIGRILRGEVNPQSGNLERIAMTFGLSLAELAQMGQEGGPPAEPIDVLKAVERSTRVALISWDQASSFAGSLNNSQPGVDKDWMPRPKQAGARTFALQVRGEAMEPDYQHGDIIFVDRDVASEHAKDVVVRLADRGEVAFRRMVVDGKLAYLRPLNSNWPCKIIEISGCPGAQIIGVVIGKWVEK